MTVFDIIDNQQVKISNNSNRLKWLKHSSKTWPRIIFAKLFWQRRQTFHRRKTTWYIFFFEPVSHLLPWSCESTHVNMSESLFSPYDTVQKWCICIYESLVYCAALLKASICTRLQEEHITLCSSIKYQKVRTVDRFCLTVFLLCEED